MKLPTNALAAILLGSTMMIAQAATAQNINQRKENQQDRIGNGVQSGRLNAGETSRLEHQEAGINREERGSARRTTAI